MKIDYLAKKNEHGRDKYIEFDKSLDNLTFWILLFKISS